MLVNDAWKSCSYMFSQFLTYEEGACFIYIICVWLRIVVSTHIVLCFCFLCLRLVYPILSVSLDCPFLIAPSVFSNVYMRKGVGDLICGLKKYASKYNLNPDMKFICFTSLFLHIFQNSNKTLKKTNLISACIWIWQTAKIP